MDLFTALNQHQPEIYWKSGEVLRYDCCFPQCFLVPSTVHPSLLSCLSALHSLKTLWRNRLWTSLLIQPLHSDILCSKRVTQLPLHWPWDCVIDLFLGEPGPQRKIYLLSMPEQKAMNGYLKWAVHQVYIHLSRTPAASSCFFWPGIHFWPRYVSVSTSISSKLDLHSVYNLIRICEGEEWKIAFVMAF